MVVDLHTHRARVGHYEVTKGGRIKHKQKKFAKNNRGFHYNLMIPVHIVALYYFLIQPSLVSSTLPIQILPLKISVLTRKVLLVTTLLFSLNLLLACGDVHPNPGPNKLFVNSLNAQSMKGTDKNKAKLIDFRNMLEVQQPDIMAVSETWLKEPVILSEIIDTNIYHLYRYDRSDIRGGGVILLVRKTLWCIERKDLKSPNPKHNEIVIAEVRPTKGRRILIFSTYRSQADPSSIFLSNLEHAIQAGCQDGVEEHLILGDLNYRELTWLDNIETSIPKHCRDLLSITNRYGYRQLNYNPSTVDGNILDIVLTNLPDTCSEVLSETYPYQSDHYLLEFYLHIETEQPKPIQRKTYNFKKADMDKINTDIRNINVLEATNNTPDSVWEHIKSKILLTITINIPTIRVKNKNSAPWIDIDIIQLSHKKVCALHKACKTNARHHWAKFKRLRNRLKNLVTAKHRDYITKLTDNLNRKPKAFWNLLGSRSKSRSSPDLIIVGNKDITNPIEKATTFNNYFASIFSKWDTNKQIPVVPINEDPNLSSMTLTEEEVKRELDGVDITKAPGPDGIPTRILKDCAENLLTPLTYLFNLSLNSATVPQEWKRANVVPVFKKGDPTQTNNYRPISLLPIISKILERLIYNKIIPFIRPKLTNMQHGFLARCSTSTQLLTVFSRINNILDTRTQTDVIYFDLSKAFDSVPHAPLLLKLKSFGINGKLHAWFSSYLSNREQRVTLDGNTSEWLPVTSGVPQGSILGPLLFLIYINDLPDYLAPDTLCAIFADDTKIFRPIESEDDTRQLQQDINNINEWGEKWGLTFNKQKCKSLSIIGTQDVIIHQYSIGNHSLERVDEMNDLGLIITSNFRWNVHITTCTKKAERQLWLIIRTLGFHSPQKAKLQTYISMVRSIIEYGSVVWNPKFKHNIYDIESIQRKATNYILNNPPYYSPNHIDYRDRLIQLKLLPTSYRREILDIIFFLKCLHGKTCFNISEYVSFVNRDRGTRTRQAELNTRLQINRTNLDSTAHFYPYRITKIWNALPHTLQTILKPLSEPLVMKQFLVPHYQTKLLMMFDSEDTCTWISWCDCNRCNRYK